MPSISARLIDLAVRLSGKRRLFARDDQDPQKFISRREAPARPCRSIARRLDIRRDTMGGFEVVTVSPWAGQDRGQVLYLHGGAYIYPITPLHWRFIARLVEATGLAFTVPLYPLAPEHDCVQAGRFVTDVYRTLLSRDAGRGAVVMGDSAGGGLTLSLAMQWRDAGLTPPTGLVLISPWLDVTMTDPSQGQIEPSDAILMRPGLRQAGRWYAGNLSTVDARVSPLGGDLTRMPPIHLVCGSHDILVVDARRLAARGRREGMDLVYHEEAGMMHVYPIFPSPEARRAEDGIVRFIRARSDAS